MSVKVNEKTSDLRGGEEPSLRKRPSGGPKRTEEGIGSPATGATKFFFLTSPLYYIALVFLELFM